MRIVPVAAVLVGLSFLAACRGSSNPATDAGDMPGPDGGGTPPTRVQDIQDPAMPVGRMVELRGVVITAIDAYGARVNAFWVQDPAGGERSGINVFNAPAAVVRTLARGDVVDITGGIKQEFAPNSDMSGRTVTQLGPPTGGMLQVTKTGTMAVPAPAVVDALAIGQKATRQERDAEWEKWEGVPITLTNIRQFNDASEVPSSNPDPTLQLFSVTGDLFLESGLAVFPAAGLGTGTCIASATGILDYVINWFVLHRDAADIVAGGTGCAPPEDNEAACTDAADNDGNALKDCADTQCVLGHSGCRTLTNVEAIQAAMPMGPIELKDVFVTGVARNKKSFWISTSSEATAKNGVFVFRSSNAPDLDPAIVTGAKVTLVGTVFEFNDDANGKSLTEVSPLQIVVAQDAAVAVTPIAQLSAAELLDATQSSEHESVLVTLTDVAITALGSTQNGSIATGKQSGTTFGLGSEALEFVSASLGCYSSMTGFWTSLMAVGSAATTKPNAFGFIPISLGATGTGCQ
jgi:hypothetical protein